MIPALAALLLAAAPASPCAPRGDAGDEVRLRACGLLGAIDRPVTTATWRSLGPEADAVLAEVVRSDDFAIRRARALEGLAARAREQDERVRVERLHRELAASSAAPVEVRRAAIRGLERLAAEPDLVRALVPLAERDADGRVRAAASEALARRAPGTACAGIRARASAAGADAVRLERALSTCTAAAR